MALHSVLMCYKILILVFMGMVIYAEQDDLDKVEKAYSDLNKAKERKEENAALMAPYSNWDQMLTPAPMAIAVLGQLMLIATETDFSLEDKPPKNGFRYLNYPNSFRTSLVQITNIGWEAFNQAHTNMDQIRLHTSNVDTHIKHLVKILMQGTKYEVNLLMPKVMKRLQNIADKCVTLATNQEDMFLHFMKVIAELLEASTNAKDVYEDKRKETEIAITVAKTEEDQAKQEKAALDEENKKITESIEQTQKDFREALESSPSTWKLFGLGLLDTFVSVVRVIPGVTMPRMSGNWEDGFDPSTEFVEESEDDRAKRHVYKFAEDINKHIQTLVSVSTSGKATGEKTPDWTNIESVHAAKSSLNIIIRNIQRIETYTNANQISLKICHDGIRLMENLIEMGMHIQRLNSDSIKNLIIEAEDLLQSSRDLVTKAALFLQTTFSNPKGPRTAKRNTRQSSSSLVQAELDNYRMKVDVTTEVLKDARKRQESVNRDMKDNNERIMKTLVELAELDLKKIDFDKIREILIKGLKAIQEVKKQWGKLIKFFQMMSNIVKINFYDSVSTFVEYVDTGRTQKLDEEVVSDTIRDLIYDQAFQASIIAHFVRSIASTCTYVEVSSKHLMDEITKLGELVALDPSTDQNEIMIERKELLKKCKEAQTKIRTLAVAKQKEHYEVVDKRIRQFQNEIKPLIPDTKSKNERKSNDKPLDDDTERYVGTE